MTDLFEYADVHPIYGPPGTGKTTQCVAIVSDLIEKGVDPRQIAYVAFTNKAADEAKDRVASKLSIPKNQLAYFSTIHAMGNRAYKAQFADSRGVMMKHDFEAVGERTSLPVRAHWKITEDADFVASGGVQYGPGDFAISQIGLARARRIPLDQQVTKMAKPEDFIRFNCQYEDIHRFNTSLEAYKHREGMYDFNDMLDRSEDCEPLPILYAIIDEAQDLSAAQWHVCHHLLRNCKTVWVAGDDDQAIYRFSGADSGTFLSMGTLPNARVLERTYRLPQSIFRYATGIIDKIDQTQRVPKDWHSKKDEGAIHRSWLNDLPLDEGDWMLLVRNRSFMKGIEELLRARGYVYRADNSYSVKPSAVRAILAWEHVRGGGDISAKDAALIYKYIKIGDGLAHGVKTTVTRKLAELQKERFVWDDLPGMLMTREAEWYRAFTDMPYSQLSYMRNVAKQGADVLKSADKPRIRIHTIHGVKGGEADNVAILPAMGRMTHDDFMQDPTDEHRCAYVAATRAKENLYILTEPSETFYPY